MKTRRDFVKLVAAASVVGGGALQAQTKAAGWPEIAAPTGDARAYWLEITRRLATPVLEAMAQRRLKATMPIEAADPAERAPFVHLEVLSRLLAGIAPWLELSLDPATPEGRLRAHFAELARASIDAATDPRSPDFVNFAIGKQPVVDAAFLAQAMLRAPTELWKKLEPQVQANVIAGLEATRPIQPGENNWQLFAAMVEVALQRFGRKRVDVRLVEPLAKIAKWYVGDGMYGDGPEFHWDYYNAFVIQPMLVETLDVVGDERPEWHALRDKALARLTRFAAIEERLIAPDGTYPIIGRSIAYRCGAFQGLALAALRHRLPVEVKPGQARQALTAVIRRTLEAPGTFDVCGWLQIGVGGHQPTLGEHYISTGSLYLCSVALLPLGLPASDPFWSDPSLETTWERVWSGKDLPADHALPSGH